MELEEEGVSGEVVCAADIPPFSRVRKVKSEFHENGREVHVSYYGQWLQHPVRERIVLGAHILS